MLKIIIISFLVFVGTKLSANEAECASLVLNGISFELQNSSHEFQVIDLDRLKSPDRLLFKLRSKFKNSQKVTAAILAFPLPFGIVGLHRIYFGTRPYVPIAYIATVGGCFGILPLIDFFVIIFEKDTRQFVNNPRVFMWAK